MELAIGVVIGIVMHRYRDKVSSVVMTIYNKVKGLLSKS